MEAASRFLGSVGHVLCTAALVATALTACSDNQPPELLPIDPQTAYVGSRFELRLIAADPEGSRIVFTFSSPSVEIQDRARISQIGGEGIFSWTPLASDVGEQQMDFVASDGDKSDMESVLVTVKPSTTGDTAPVFRKPLGEGTTLDLAAQKCISGLEVLVEDPDSVQVDLRQLTAIPGSSMKATGPFGATFSWCPTAAQSTQQRFVLRFLADDHDNPPVCPKVCKDYTVLIRSDLPPVCAGAAPVITHSAPGPQTTADPIVVRATVTDDKGLKPGMPWLYFTNTKPTNPAKLNFSALSQLGMVSVGGNDFEAKIPNPTPGIPAGESRTVYYVIVAEDDDDPTANCDHRTQLPAADLFQATVTKPAAATPCAKTAECSPGEVCGGTSCIKDACTAADTNGDQIYWEQSGCPASHYCPARGPGISPSHCVQSCISDADCKQAGYKCKVFDTKKGCGLAGSKGVGDGCADFTECSGKAMCLQWEGGYCSISDCDSFGGFSGACPSGSACVPMPDPRFSVKKHWLCLKTCQGDGDCRQGYTCKTVLDDQDTTRKACL